MADVGPPPAQHKAATPQLFRHFKHNGSQLQLRALSTHSLQSLEPPGARQLSRSADAAVTATSKQPLQAKKGPLKFVRRPTHHNSSSPAASTSGPGSAITRATNLAASAKLILEQLNELRELPVAALPAPKVFRRLSHKPSTPLKHQASKPAGQGQAPAAAAAAAGPGSRPSASAAACASPPASPAAAAAGNKGLFRFHSLQQQPSNLQQLVTAAMAAAQWEDLTTSVATAAPGEAAPEPQSPPTHEEVVAAIAALRDQHNKQLQDDRMDMEQPQQQQQQQPLAEPQQQQQQQPQQPLAEPQQQQQQRLTRPQDEIAQSLPHQPLPVEQQQQQQLPGLHSSFQQLLLVFQQEANSNQQQHQLKQGAAPSPRLGDNPPDAVTATAAGAGLFRDSSMESVQTDEPAAAAAAAAAVAGGAADVACDPGLIAVAAVIKQLLQLAAQHASQACADQLREQLIRIATSAAAAAQAAGVPFDLAAALKHSLPPLQRAVTQAWVEHQAHEAAAATAAVTAGLLPTSPVAVKAAAAAASAAALQQQQVETASPLLVVTPPPAAEVPAPAAAATTTAAPSHTLATPVAAAASGPTVAQVSPDAVRLAQAAASLRQLQQRLLGTQFGLPAASQVAAPSAAEREQGAHALQQEFAKPRCPQPQCSGDGSACSSV